MKGLRLSFNWTDTGATCLASREGFNCPRCGLPLHPGVVHKCGDQLSGPANVKRRSRKRTPEAK